MKGFLANCVLFALVLSSCKKNVYKPNPVIIDFTPDKGAYNLIITIRGKNFDSLINNTTVSFNGSAGAVVSVSENNTTLAITNQENLY